MATITHVRTLDYAAKMLGEDVELLEAIVWNGDNLTYGTIISVYTGSDQASTALTDDGVEELSDMLRDARRTTETWHGFLDDFVDDPELAARFKAQTPR
ncbi:hypothetical protein C100_06460 [Sphingobium sp. C100]|jgi:hypothetical protein|uniref:hypothetical protein n=1 Tax=Sphingobium sp. C100 TaxID=1207055 RepID=UPI0003D695F7|nr:hypothetical protein [Sphingobium sp. C100]ETI64614.1 hypothetical protein C100_06460 [Sphingobium sp. C100]